MADFLNILIGNVRGIYVGDADLSDELTKVDVPLTQGSHFSFQMPQEFKPADRKRRQSAFCRLEFQVTFFPSPEADRLSVGNALTAPKAYTPSTESQYALLLLAEYNEDEESIYVPRCQTVVDHSRSKTKSDYERVTVTFVWDVRNRFATPLPYYKDTAYNLRDDLIIPALRCPQF